MIPITSQKRYLERSKVPLLIRHESWTGELPLSVRRVTLDDEPIRGMHVHAGLEVGFCHDGVGFLMAEDKVFTFKASDVCVVSQAETHGLRARRNTRSTWSFIHFDPAMVVSARSDFPPLLRTAELAGPDFPNVLPGEDHPRIIRIIELLLDELGQERPGRTAAASGLLCSLLVHLHRLPEVCGIHTSRTPDAVERVAPAMRWMEAHYDQDVGIAELACLCHVSESHFRKLFREVMGVSALRYLTNIRLHMGAHRLRTTRKTILQIAYEVGYANVSSFNRHFKRFFGRTPRQWRAEVNTQS